MSRDYTARLKADSSGFKKGVDEAVGKLNELNKKLMDNQYRQKDSNKAISEARKELNKITKEIGDVSKADDEQKKKIEELNSTIEQEKLRLVHLRSEQQLLKGQINETSKAVVDHNKEWTVLKGTLANLASDGIKAVGNKLLALGRDVLQTGMEFTSTMSEVKSISGATAEELEELENAARLYGSTTVYSANEAAEALKYMALAGWSAQQSIDGLPAVLSLAAAAGMDLGKASDIVTDYVTAFGLSVSDAAHFTDVMTYAQMNSNTTVEMLGEAYKNCAATANSMGFSLEEVTAALMTMANAGIKGGEAGTTLNTLMTRLATNAKGCANELAAMGVQIYDSAGNMHSLSDILNRLIGVWGSLTQAQQASISKMIAGTNQYAGFQTIMQGLSDSAKAAGMSFNDYTAALESCDGAAEKAASTMSDNLSGDLKALQSALDELKLKIFQDAEQPLRSLVQTLTKTAIPATEEIIKHLDVVLPVIIGCATAMATFKFNLIIGDIISSAAKAIRSLGTAAAASAGEVKALSAEMKLLSSSNVIGLVLTAVVSLGSALLTMAAANAEATGEIREAAPALTAYMQSMNKLHESKDKALEDAAGEAAILDNLKQEYDELRGKTALTAEENNRLTTVSEQLASKLGLTTKELRDQSGAYRDLTGDINTYIKSLENKALVEFYEEQIKQAAIAKNRVQEELQEAEAAYLDAQKAMEKYEEEMNRPDKIPDVKNKLGKDGEYEVLAYALSVARLNYADLKAVVVSAEVDIDEATRKMKEINGGLLDNGDALRKASGEIGQVVAQTAEANKLLDKSAQKTQTLAEQMAELSRQSSSVRSEMTGLADSLSKLQKGESLSLSTLLELCDKYPDYAAELMNAAGNADLQRAALEKLFNARRQEYIMTQEAAIRKIEASNEETRVLLQNYEAQRLAAVLGATLAAAMGGGPAAFVANAIGSVAQSFSSGEMDLRQKLAENERLLEGYRQKIAAAQGWTFADFASSTQTTAGTSGSGSRAASKTSAASKTADDPQKQANERLLEAQKLALAAYNRLVDNKIDLYQKEADAAQAAADKQIAALDAVMKKRNEEKEDAKKQEELNKINARLRYEQMDKFSRIELERRRQDLLNEMAETQWSRRIEQQKESIRAGADAVSDRTRTAVDRLTASKTQFADRMAYLQGTQSYDQRVQNNSKSVNFTIVQSGMSGDQVLKKIIDGVRKELGV